MRKVPRQVWTLCGLALVAACRQVDPRPDLGEIYDRAAQEIGAERTPVIVLPGALGSKLENASTRSLVWGAFTHRAVDAGQPEGAREIAIPMVLGMPLADLRDDVEATEVLDTLQVRISILPAFALAVYADIMRALAAGNYRDATLGGPGGVNYGGLHTTCYQLAYDWRREVSESAIFLHDSILAAQDSVRATRGLAPGDPVRVDVVAHSMGALVLRYYLRYGPHVLPDDGSVPELTWEGAANVSRAILVSPPNAGSVLALDRLVRGWGFGSFVRHYPAAVIGTMPAVYQLLPRARHRRVVDATTMEPIDVFDPGEWERRNWGLLDPRQDKVLGWLLPDVGNREERRRIALDHLTKCLRRAEQLHRALDVPASPPPQLELYLFAGDALPTPSILAVEPSGALVVVESVAGDDEVTRSSALMDERIGKPWVPELRSPITWTGVQFINQEHLGITRDIAFTDNLLYLLLEAPRTDSGHVHHDSLDSQGEE